MRRLFAALLLTAAVTAATADDDDPVLFRLVYRLQGETEITHVAVEGKPGVSTSSKPGEKPDRWRLEPGDTLQGRRPRERIVDLYQDVKSKALLIGRIHVRYYPKKGGGWQPFYRPEPASELARTLPDLQTPMRFRGVLAVSGGALPIPDGYYPFVEFRFDPEKPSIDRWRVR